MRIKTLFRSNLRSNLILQYSLLTFIVIASVSVITAKLVSSYSVNRIIEAHIQSYPIVVEELARNNDEIISYFENDSTKNRTEHFPNIFEQLATMGDVFRIKIWNTDRIVLWSTDEEIIGKQFLRNEPLEQAIIGKVAYVLEEPDSDENESENEVGEILEIYTR